MNCVLPVRRVLSGVADALLAPLIVAASVACVSQAAAPPAKDTAVNAAATGSVLLEVVVQAPQGSPSGFRVLADGRYQSYSGQVFGLDASKQVTVRSETPAWRTVYTFTAPEMARLRDAVRAAGFARLQPRYPAPAGVNDAATVTWRAWVDGKPREVVVQGHPVNSVPALDTLFAEINRIHAWPKESSTWIVRRAGRVTQRSVPCMAVEVPALLGVIQALHDKRWSHPAGGTAVTGAAPAPALLEIAWMENGTLSSRTRLYADGRLTDERGGTESHTRTLDATGLARVQAALDTAALDSRAEPICP